MKALRLDDLMTFSYVDVPAPSVGDGDVLVAVRACGICGSDIHGFDGTSGRRTPPLIMGHEASGVVVGAGHDAGSWREGDRVTFDSTVFCGGCPACLDGRTNLCEQRAVLGSSFSGHWRDGAFADLVAVPGRALVSLPDELTFERAAFAEPLSVALHAVALAGDVADRTVAVVGTGVIGLLVVQALRVAGARRVIGIDLDPQRLEIARRLGADATFRADDEHVERQVVEATDGRGADAVVEAVGVPAAIGTAIGCARRGGRVVLVGNITPMVEIPLQAVVTGELTLVGSCASAGEFGRSVELLASGAADVDPLISAVAPLADGAHWFEQLHAAPPGLLKVILTPPNGAA
jgi:L-iditol 2-dehydrogenase